MEFRRYLELARKRWWVVATVFALTAITTTALALQQPWVYESDGTFIVKPRTVDAGDAVRATDTLVRGPEIGATFAYVAGSERVEQVAKANLPEGVDTSGLVITSDVVIGRNAIKVTVRGGDPEAVYAMAVAVSDETVRAVAELNDSFDVHPLDAPRLPTKPVAPNKALTIVLGTVLGFMAGIGLAVGIEFVSEISLPGKPFNIVNESLDVYNRRFFDVRFREEISRARRGHGGFSIGVARISIDGRDRPSKPALRHAAGLVRSDLREEDLLAYLGDGSLAVLMPDLPLEHAEAFMAKWESSIASKPMAMGDGTATTLETVIAVAEYDGREEAADPVGDQVSQLL